MMHKTAPRLLCANWSARLKNRTKANEATGVLTGALAGILMALDSGLTTSLPVIGLKAFPAALVGGLDSLAGALVGALIVAAAEVLLIYYVDPSVRSRVSENERVPSARR